MDLRRIIPSAIYKLDKKMENQEFHALLKDWAGLACTSEKVKTCSVNL